MSEEYARVLAKMAVGQIADLAGYEAAHSNALEAVGDVLIRYMREIGLYAKECAEAEGRTDVTAPDVVDALDEMGHSCTELLEYHRREPRDPFAHVVPEFPVIKQAAPPVSFKSAGITPPAHIPAHLPAFPEEHTMKFSGLFRKRKASKKEDHIELSRKRRQAEAALIQLQQKRLNPPNTAERQNPFISAAPLQEAEPLALAPPASDAAGVSSVRDVFKSVVKEKSAADTGTVDVDGDAEMRHEDDPHADISLAHDVEQGVWPPGTKPAVEDAKSDTLFKSGQILFSVDMASRLERLAMSTRNALTVEDAFEKNDKQTADGARRRASLFDTDKLKRKRALTILECGADAFNMDERQEDDF